MRVCSEPGCPTLTQGTYCDAHRRDKQRAKDAARPSSHRRGYGTRHQRIREREGRRVATGTVACARCGELIRPGEAWDLDHTDDRADYLGPSHARCNRATKTHQAARQQG